MDFQKIVSRLNYLRSVLGAYDSGDLMALVELKNTFQELADEMEGTAALKDVCRFAQLLSKLSMKLSVIESEKETLRILKESADGLSALFNKEKNGQESAALFNRLAREAQPILLARPREEQTSSLPSYSEDYFKSIVDDKKMLSQLADEVKEHLDSAQFTLVELEYDDTNQENINKVFRNFHTIKGSSAFLGLKNIEEVGHEMENLLVLLRDGKLRISRDLIDVIFFGIELLRNLVSIMETNDFVIPKMAESFKKVDIFDYIGLIRKILSQYQVKKIGEILEEEGKLRPTDVRHILDRQTKTEKKFGEIAVDEKLITKDELKDAIQKQKAPVGKKASYVKVSNERLNSLIDIVGELVINQSMLKQTIGNKEDATDTAERTISQLETITTNIKNLVLSMGMVPIAEIFNKLRVVIRNTSQELGRAIVVDIRGEETELDRNVIESIYDPLVHMVRNSVDHGIEPPDEREKLKKDRVGRIVVSAEHKGNGIEISVYDDGRGIDRDRVKEKALSMGLVEKEKIDTMSDREIYALMFLPGFSTAQKVTEVSGRGVGLDVVKKNIEEIHGRIEVTSQKGQYTRFVIKLPLTLAIIEGFVTTIGQNKYVFPFNSIDEIMVPKAEFISTMDDGSMMLFNRGVYIPMLFAGEICHETDYKTALEDIILIIISHDNKNYGIVVDRVLGKQEIVIKTLGEVLQGLSVFSGGTIFGDGTIGFVVDIEGFLEEVRA